MMDDRIDCMTGGQPAAWSTGPISHGRSWRRDRPITRWRVSTCPAPTAVPLVPRPVTARAPLSKSDESVMRSARCIARESAGTQALPCRRSTSWRAVQVHAGRAVRFAYGYPTKRVARPRLESFPRLPHCRDPAARLTLRGAFLEGRLRRRCPRSAPDPPNQGDTGLRRSNCLISSGCHHLWRRL
jgi:hypothetical protein